MAFTIYISDTSPELANVRAVLLQHITEKGMTPIWLDANERQQPESRLEQIPLSKPELAVIDYLKTHPRITLPQFMKLVNFGKRRAYQTLIKLVLHGYLHHHDKEREVYYTL